MTSHDKLECSQLTGTVCMHSCQSSRVLQLQEPRPQSLAWSGTTSRCHQTYQLPEGCQHGPHACHFVICMGRPCTCKVSGAMNSALEIMCLPSRWCLTYGGLLSNIWISLIQLQLAERIVQSVRHG